MTEDVLARIDRLQQEGNRAACLDALRTLARDASNGPPGLLHDVAQRYTMLGLHEEAERAHAAVVALAPGEPGYRYNHAAALIAVGRLRDAEAALEHVLRQAPHDADARYNLATLRRQTPEANHVDALQARLRDCPPGAAEEVALCHALAKELEDLGEDERSFAALQRGARARKRRLAYRVEDDVDTMQAIADGFDAGFLARDHGGHDDSRPLFVVGLPRSGTTLVDRIIDSHPAACSRGETADLAMALVRAAGPVRDKQALVERATTLDHAALGRDYCTQLSDDPAASRQVDKTPVNFLYLGIIAAALPRARIVHVRRNPMDACYAIHKTLFRMAYPFSYDLDDLAAYWLGYHRLMAHWRAALPPGCMLEIDYEDLVAHQEDCTRRLLAHTGLDWDPACLAFHRNPSPSLTASAAQVRQPIYSSSVGLWRRYERQLQPLATRLREAGIDIEGEAA